MSPTKPDSLGSGTRATNAGFRKLSLRSLLVAMQIALSVILLVGAGLPAQSLLRLLNTSMGFRADHLLTARFKLPSRRFPDNVHRSAFFDALINQVEAIPGVTEASGVTCLPLTGKDCWPSVFRIEGQPPRRPADMFHSHFNAVEPGYWRTM